MRIGGFQKFTLIDYPGKIAAVVFTQGCNFRCPYCHNSELVIPSFFNETLNEEEIISFLFERKEKLQGLVVTGGEPTMQKDLVQFLKKIKDMGLSVKLDTNGSKPQVLEEVIKEGLVDFVCMDIKAPLENYSTVTGVNAGAETIVNSVKESIKIILNSGIDHVFRTTVVKSLISAEDVEKIPFLIPDANRYILQNFVYRDGVMDQNLLDQSHYSDEEFEDLQEKAEFNKFPAPQETI